MVGATSTCLYSKKRGAHRAEVLHINTAARKQVVDLTDQVEAVIRKTKLQEGLCSLFITHTTAALTTGEVGEGPE